MTKLHSQLTPQPFRFETDTDQIRVQTLQNWKGVPYHFHPEFEFLYVTGGSGRRFVGNDITDFRGPIMVLLGPGLAHGWMMDRIAGRSAQRMDALVVTFHLRSLGAAFPSLPDFAAINRLLDRAHRGLAFAPNAIEAVRVDLERMAAAPAGRRLMLFLLVLESLSHHTDVKPIVAADYAGPGEPNVHRAFERAMTLIHADIGRSITLAEAARHLGMSEPTFSRFFRRMTGKSYLAYVLDWRLRQAVILLEETDRTVLDISTAVGFSNLSNFNRQFRRKMNRTPVEFRHRSGQRDGARLELRIKEPDPR